MDPGGCASERADQNLSLDFSLRIFGHLMSLCRVVSGVLRLHTRQLEVLENERWCALYCVIVIFLGFRMCSGKMLLVNGENLH
jgi:hypothetical protein